MSDATRLRAAPRIHPSATIEPGVEIGDGTAVWEHVHIRGPGTVIGHDCIVGEKTYIAYGVRIGDRCKLNALVYVPTGVTIGDGVMISAGTVFTNDRYPRATTPDLAELRDSGPGEDTLPTVVGDGVTIGAGALIGPGLEIGRFAMVGMGAVVTHRVPAHHLVAGAPARTKGCVCACGEPLGRAVDGALADDEAIECRACGRSYTVRDGAVAERELAR